MSLVSAANRAKNLLIRAEISLNRALGREFIPKHRPMFHIEVSSACNLKCRFCAYTKKSTPTVSMSYDCFVHTVDEAIDLGYTEFELTPCTGDVFMDRTLMRKLDYLEQHPRVRSYEFFTNLTIPTPRTVESLAGLRKLKHLTVSVYGHDRDSFVAIAGAKEKLYARLVANLGALLAVHSRSTYALAIGLRTSRRIPRGTSSEILSLIDRFREAGAEIWISSGVYNNWGGYISQKDVEGLDMEVTSTDSVYKFGACEKLFNSVQVTATGVVNACACRDVESTLRIGNVNEAPLADIVSPKNPEYMAIIDEQQRGTFRPICQSCDFYKSIYHQRSHYRRQGIPVFTLEEFKAQLTEQSEKGKRQRSLKERTIRVAKVE